MHLKTWMTFLAALLFLEATPSAEACTCIRAVLQQSFCSSSAVLRVKFIRASQPNSPTSSKDTVTSTGYEIQTLQVLKGNATLRNVTFVSTMAGSTCAYHHPENSFNTDYLIAGSSIKNRVSISFCSYKMPWNKLSAKQIQGIQGAYLRGCECDIVPCFYPPCPSTSDQCNFTDSKNLHKDQICARNAKGVCSWGEIQ